MFLAGDTRYYMEYRSDDFHNRLEYRLINLTAPKRQPITIMTDYRLLVLEVKPVKLTHVEAAVCRKKGMIVPEHLIQKRSDNWRIRLVRFL